MGEFLSQLWQNIIGRASGPMWPRLIIQPAVATFFAIRAGLRDAKKGQPPYGWAVLTHEPRRGHLVAHGWSEVGKVFVIAAILDGIYQRIVFHRVYFAGALMMAAVLSLVPYFLLRGLVNRIASLRRRSTPNRQGESNGSTG